ncbi:2-hydroxy-3-oxopropionate reductase [Nocardia terpenica]|uniref:2-hydroxy-3-oxopropionate reductase n=1 Tax=Nocardia terpenica TaxID=455432 RepID=UPI0018960288|nr:2-hydroxy-3-oxopropionate reductase [Nocardia terpenica]MBF6064802.1 2-hydroxy-3-oxopropionate reductase [Nocardia terpenica]MBF6107317.1 2-hydroxy-3-oxopropionate reductase [Nocardia terpenica]MBF6115074.1 2-hydroxy-3-oxopropionate reductase [Nocardia terpenica]MBF6122180.1 2-hydroxy-3-oxopropionate reductase [Nocardia terpenica]MBF6154563.1 2-hydroxy-3-oxopropionate reductase [Nocardia terpenica]
MSRIGFIGLGIMGSPMASHLVKAGHQVTGYTLNTEAYERLSADGGKTAASIAEAVADAEIVITMLPNHPQVEEVVLGEDGVFAHAPAGALLIDFSTIRPESSIAIAETGARAGYRVLDAPVSGGQAGAEQGVLSIMAGGDDADFAAATPIFEAVGKTFIHVGPHGAGQVVKAANQLVVGGTYALVAEAIVLMEALGVDAGKGLDVLAGGLAGSRILELKRTSMVAREFAPGFRIDLHHKDMGIVSDAARQAEVALPVSGIVASLIAAGRAQGYGSLDHSALLKVIENLNGRGA